MGCFGGVCVVVFFADVGFWRFAGFFGWMGFLILGGGGFKFSLLIFGLETSLENGVDYLSIYLSVCLEDASSKES